MGNNISVTMQFQDFLFDFINFFEPVWEVSCDKKQRWYMVCLFVVLWKTELTHEITEQEEKRQL
jgi:hypothetical protein